MFMIFLPFFFNIIVTCAAVATRSLAGLILKNNIKQYYGDLPEEVKQYARVCCLESLGDAAPLVRTTVGILLSTIVKKMTEDGELAQPEMLSALVVCLDSPDFNVCEVRSQFASFFSRIAPLRS